jgi:hypothetical protein
MNLSITVLEISGSAKHLALTKGGSLSTISDLYMTKTGSKVSNIWTGR